MTEEPGRSAASPLTLAAGERESEVLRLLIELCAQFVGATEGSLLLLDPSEDPPESLVFAMTVGSAASEAALRGQRVPLGEGVVGLAAVTHEVQIGSPRYAGIEYAHDGTVPAGEPTSLIAAPVLARDDLLGVITAVTFERGQRFGDDAARLYARAAAAAGLILDQARQLARSGADPEPA